ncbi:hypothetical protein F1559_003642 [Cyanidiococcus yangmingshanensis]|uniref:Uncharacterized protein n=1 Tax=Cyanidiococcus yangmingshanensis TaxID=2690220 RepID=A0A7J7II74_9RHOD|nr:hypothetical protein F1559_003642 [Cyanidiococcus yangmingshanensis]
MANAASITGQDAKTAAASSCTQDDHVDMDALERIAADVFLRVNELERTLRSDDRVDQAAAASTHAPLLARIQELEARNQKLSYENERLKYRVIHLVRNLEALKYNTGPVAGGAQLLGQRGSEQH